MVSVVSLFQEVQMVSQIAGGIWADRIGGKQVLGFGVIWWSAATMLTPIAAKLGLPALLFVRACMGVGEVSYLYPCIYVLRILCNEQFRTVKSG